MSMALEGGEGSVSLYLQERPGTHCTRSWVGPGPVWTGAEDLALTGIRSPDRPACSQSLCRLSYLAPGLGGNDGNEQSDE